MKYSDLYGMGHFEGIFDIPLAKFNSGIFVEIGTWTGRNTAYMAERIRDLKKDIKFYAIDTFKGSFSDITREMAVDQFNGDFYDVFIKNMKDCNVLDYIIPLRIPSIEAAKLFEDKSIDFCFIDAEHTYEAIAQDIFYWLPKMKHGGIMAGDDYQLPFDNNAVQRAVDSFFHNAGKSWWWMAEV